MTVAYSVENHPNDSRVKIDETGKVQALTSRMGTGGGNVPMVIEPRVINLNKGDVQSKTILDPDGIAPSLYAGECRGGGGECYVLDKKPLCMATQQGGAEIMEDKSPTITAAAGMSGNNQPVVCIEGNGSRPSHLGDGYKETDVMYTLNATEQHAVAMPIHDKATRHMGKHGDNHDGAGNGLGVGSDGDPKYTLTSGDHHAVCTDVGFFNSTEDVSTSLLARMYKDPPLVTIPNSECVTQYIVRWLTPLECNRLQGFPDGWGETDPKEDFTDEEFQFWHEVRNTYAAINGKKLQAYTKQQMLSWYNKLHTDSAEYKMWGNGIALPTALYVMEGIAEALRDQESESCESN